MKMAFADNRNGVSRQDLPCRFAPVAMFSHMGRPRRDERRIILAASVPESMADVVAAHAKERGMTVAQLIRVALTEYTKIPVAKDSDWVIPPDKREEVQEQLQEQLLAKAS